MRELALKKFDSAFALNGTLLEGQRQSLPPSDAIEWRDEFKPAEFTHDEMRYKRLRKNIGVAAKLHSVSITGGKSYFNVCMVTLTYRPGVDWHKTHMSAYMDHVRKWHMRRTGRELKYVWVAEIQTLTRGVIHYHVLYFMPKGITMPKADKQGWWPHGSTRTERAVAPVNYVMKYASKLDTKKGFPKNARTYGIGGLAEIDRLSRRWLNQPAFVKARASITDRWDRAVGGGWVERSTGQIWPSEWGVCLVTKQKVSIVRLHDHGRPMDVGGPFEWIDRKPVLQ